MRWSEAEVETILEQMRAGASVMSGGSRCHTTYFHRAGEWFYEDFDEGSTHEGSTSEAAMRERIASEPELFRGVLSGLHWRRFTAAYLAGELEPAREHLRVARSYGDDDKGKIFAALLAWPATPPAQEVVAAIRSNLSGFTAYHVYMGATGWDRRPEAAAGGIAFADLLIAMVGETTGCNALRSTFHEQAKDLAAAERDLALELERCVPDKWPFAHVEKSLERVRQARALERA